MVSGGICAKSNAEICGKIMNPKIKCVLVMIASWILIWLLVVFIASCSVEKQINNHLKQSERQYKKAIRKGYTPKIDTVYIKDSVFIERVRVDSIFRDVVGDTIIINKDRLKLKYVRSVDSVFIEAECLADTIIKEIPISVQEKIFIKTTLYENVGLDTRWKKLTFWVVLVISGLLILYLKFKP